MDYLSIIENGKQWSWSLILLIFFIAGLILRSILLRNILFNIKRMPRDLSRFVQSEYGRASLMGWIFFAVSIALIVLIWFQPGFLIRFVRILIWQLGALICFAISVYIHALAYTNALFKLIDDKLAAPGKDD